MSDYSIIQQVVNDGPGQVLARPPKSTSWGSEIAISHPSLKVKTYKCFDTINLGLFVDWSGSCILDRLREGKEQALEKYEPVPFAIGGVVSGIIHPNGKRGGYRYHLQVGDINLFFSTRDPDSETPNVFVEIGSFSLNEAGLNTVEQRIESWIALMGGEVEHQKLSRVDLTVDFIGLAIAELGITDPELWITRSKRTALYHYGRTVNAFCAGSGDLMLRIYDKRLELTQSRATAKLELFNELWEDTESPVTRVEFQLRRDTLKEFEVSTITELFAKTNAIWQYLVTSWFRISAEVVDRDHSSRVTDNKIHSFWQQVQKVAWYGFKPVNRAKKYVRRNIDQLKLQAMGCLESLAIAVLRSIDKKGMAAIMKQELNNYLNNYPEDRDKVRKRQVKLAECIEFNIVPF